MHVLTAVAQSHGVDLTQKLLSREHQHRLAQLIGCPIRAGNVNDLRFHMLLFAPKSPQGLHAEAGIVRFKRRGKIGAAGLGQLLEPQHNGVVANSIHGTD